jgi:hypothetical protein
LESIGRCPVTGGVDQRAEHEDSRSTMGDVGSVLGLSDPHSRTPESAADGLDMAALELVGVPQSLGKRKKAVGRSRRNATTAGCSGPPLAGVPATAAAGVGGAKGAGGGGTVATRVALCEPSVLVAFYISF